MAAGDEKLHAGFYNGTQKNDAKSAEAGRPVFDDVVFIKIFTPGDKDTVIDRPAWIQPKGEWPNANSDSQRFPEALAKFQASQSDEVVSGTPVAMLPGISKGQVEELRYFHIHTVEGLAHISDGNLSKFMGGQALKTTAIDYLARAAGAAADGKLRLELEKRDADIASLRAALLEQGKSLEAMKTEGKPKQQKSA